MKNILGSFIFIALSAGLSSCGTDVEHVYINNAENASAVTSLKKDNSVEVVLQTKHLNNKFDLMTTIQRVFVDSNLIKEIIHYDTLPRLSKGKKEIVDAEGNKKDTVADRDYSFYVTIK